MAARRRDRPTSDVARLLVARLPDVGRAWRGGGPRSQEAYLRLHREAPRGRRAGGVPRPRSSRRLAIDHLRSARVRPRGRTPVPWRPSRSWPGRGPAARRTRCRTTRRSRSRSSALLERLPPVERARGDVLHDARSATRTTRSPDVVGKSSANCRPAASPRRTTPRARRAARASSRRRASAARRCSRRFLEARSRRRRRRARGRLHAADAVSYARRRRQGPRAPRLPDRRRGQGRAAVDDARPARPAQRGRRASDGRRQRPARRSSRSDGGRGGASPCSRSRWRTSRRARRSGLVGRTRTSSPGPAPDAPARAIRRRRSARDRRAARSPRAPRGRSRRSWCSPRRRAAW